MDIQSPSAWRNLTRVTISIDDPPCGCSGSISIERHLASLRGVVQAYVNPHTEMAYVAFDPCACRLEQIYEVIRELGYCPGETQVRARL